MADVIGATKLDFNPANIAEDYKKNLTENMNRQASAMDLVKKTQDFEAQQGQKKAMQENYSPETGQVNLPGLRGSSWAQQNPDLAMSVEKHIRENGLEATAQRARETSDYFAKMKGLDPSDTEGYQAIIKDAVANGHPEFAKLPPVPLQSTIDRGLMTNQSASQQVSNLMETKKAFQGLIQKALENGTGIDPEWIKGAGYAPPGEAPKDASQRAAPPSWGAYTSVAPGRAMQGSKLDREIAEKADASFGQKIQSNPAYSMAHSNLLRVNNVMEVFNKYKKHDGSYDLNKVNTQDENTIATELASAMKGGAAPTEAEVEALKANNMSARSAHLKAQIFGGTVPLNNAEYYKGLLDYTQGLKNNSLDQIRPVIEQHYNDAGAMGMHPATVSDRKRSALGALEKESTQGRPQQYEPDVLAYAKAHKIPAEKAAEIKQRRSGKGQ